MTSRGGHSDHGRPIRFAYLATITIIAAIVTVIGIAISWRVQQDHENERLCLRSVSSREDTRAMWEWLIDAVAETSPLADEARVELDRLLPDLTCDEANHPIPIVDPSPARGS